MQLGQGASKFRYLHTLTGCSYNTGWYTKGCDLERHFNNVNQQCKRFLERTTKKEEQDFYLSYWILWSFSGTEEANYEAKRIKVCDRRIR